MCLHERKYAQTKYIYSLFVFHVFFCTTFIIHIAPFVFSEIRLPFSDFSNFSIKTYIVAPYLNHSLRWFKWGATIYVLWRFQKDALRIISIFPNHFFRSPISCTVSGINSCVRCHKLGVQFACSLYMSYHFFKFLAF